MCGIYLCVPSEENNLGICRVKNIGKCVYRHLDDNGFPFQMVPRVEVIVF